MNSRLFEGYLWRHVTQTSGIAAHLVEVVINLFRLSDLLSKAEIEDLDITSDVKPNVVWLEVAVDDAEAMQVAKGGGKVVRDEEALDPKIALLLSLHVADLS